MKDESAAAERRREANMSQNMLTHAHTAPAASDGKASSLPTPKLQYRMVSLYN